MNGQTIRTITVRGTSEGLDKLTGDLNKLAAAEQNVAIVSEQSAKRMLSLDQQWQRQTLRLDAAAKAQNNIARETKIADSALREGLATQQQHAQRLEQINQRYNMAGQATEKFTQQSGLARHELINLGRQAQDVAVSLASGQSPMMVLMQQGSQIADVFIASGKSVGAFFTQAISWATAFARTPAGIVTGVAAIGAAAVYAASQFVGASKTIQEALEEENRLLKEGKALIDARTSAEARAQLQARGQTQFENLQNALDLQRKLNAAMEEAIKLAARRSTTPTQVPGEMGEAPTAFRPSQVSGLKEMAAALEQLKAAQEAGLPGLKAFNDELGRIGIAHPELKTTVEELLRIGPQLEDATTRAKALQAALKGVATDAQMAALGFKSIAQYQLNTLLADQARDATERRAKATLEIAAAYPGMSVEVAKQARSLQQQLEVTQATTGAQAIQLRFEQQIADAGLRGLSVEEATLLAVKQRALALAQVNAEADRQLKTLQNEYELIRASSEEEKGRIRARQEYNKLIDEGVDSFKASNIASQMQANARATQDASDATESWSVQMDNANDAINSVSRSLDRNAASANAAAAATARYFAEYEKAAFLPFSTLDMMGGFGGLYQSPQGGYSQFDPAGYTSTRYTSHQVPPGSPLASDFSSQLGLDKITDPLTRLALGLGPLTEATKENTEATSAMTDVLSPFYSSDPRRTHLGFRAFAGGGIMTQYGELPLKHYQGGGMATSPQVAMFGEGSTPEAFVPVPSGRIPVEIKAPANNNQRPITVNINVLGNADDRTVGALKTTAFQQAQSMRRAMS